MTRFVIIYRGDGRPEDGAAHMTRWRDWMGGLGGALIDPGAPFSRARLIDSNEVSDSVGPDRAAGYSIVEIESLEKATEIAMKCPHLDIGSIEIAEVMDMKMM